MTLGPYWLLKVEIYKWRPDLEYAADNRQMLNILITTAQKAWAGIRDQVLIRLLDTMPNRVAAVIAAQGWYMKY